MNIKPQIPDSPRENASTAVVIPVFNRKQTTLRCLANLEEMGVTEWAAVIVVDADSPDGTSAAIQESFPSTRVIHGTRDWWWARATWMGMEAAMTLGSEVVFWLNDDCIPEKGVLEALRRQCLETHGICSAQSVTPAGFVYGGVRKRIWGLESIVAKPREILRCDATCGNCVALHRDVIDSLGPLDYRWIPHTNADVDYGMRASGRGFAVEVLGDARCRNDDNLEAFRSIFAGNLSAREILGLITSLKTHHYWRTQVRIRLKHWHVLGLLHLAAIYSRFLIAAAMSKLPVDIRRRLFSRFSKAERVRRHYETADAGSTAPPAEIWVKPAKFNRRR